MNQSTFQTRRATADDIPQLRQLWHNTGWPAAELEKCFTEFQVVEDADGRILGTIGIRIRERHGWLHSESYLDFGQSGVLRPILWQRMSNVASSYALLRFWTTDGAPYWRQQDFIAPNEEEAQRRPAEFGPSEGKWLTLKLREDIDANQYLEKEFLLFKQAESERNQNLLEQAKWFKTLATVIAFIVLVLCGFGLFYLMRNQALHLH